MKAWVKGWVAAFGLVGCVEGEPNLIGDSDDEEDVELVEDDEEEEDEPVECEVPEVLYCGAEAPDCAPATECSECTEHDQCPGTACNMLVGWCYAREDVRVVDALQCGRNPDVFCSISNAIADMPLRGVVRIAGATEDENVIVNGKQVAVVADPGIPVSVGTVSAYEGDVYLSGVDTKTNSVICQRSRMWLDEVQLDGAILSEDCEITIRRSEWDVTGFAYPESSLFVIENSFVRLEQGLMGPSTTYELNHSSVYTAQGVTDCASSPAALIATGSLFLSHGDFIDPAACGTDTLFHGNAGTSPVFAGADGNRQLLEFSDAPVISSYDMHLLHVGGLEGIADAAGAPPTDIDGDPRDPLRPIPGADVP